MRVAALFGPTGSGKTALAAALADRLPLHLISCDAVQVYRDLRAASAKPEGDECRHPWALVDLVEPIQDIDLGQWVRAAEREIEWAERAGRWPLVVGGTGLYLRGLLKGVADAPPRDEALRERLRGLEARRGLAWLHRVLARLDEGAAAKIGVRDRQRILRALEIRLLTGAPAHSLHGADWGGQDRFPALRLHLDPAVEVLDRRITVRAAAFVRSGLLAEAATLLARGVPRVANALKGIGYREAVAVLSGELEEAALAAEIARSTRRYARRQRTWFRKERPALVADGSEEDLVPRFEEALRAHFAGTGTC